MSKNEAKAELEAGAPDLERRGRILGIALFWLLLCYVIGMSSRSIIPAVFWPGHAPVGDPLAAMRCAEQVDALERQLLRHASAAIDSGDLAEARRRLGAWDKRSLALAAGCGPLERSREDLLELRAGIGSLLDAYESGPLQAHQRIRRALHSSNPANLSEPQPGPK